MPIPKPKKGESKEDFVGRCMSNPTMRNEYPDRKQRFAICMDSWRNKNKKKKQLEKQHAELHEIWKHLKNGEDVDNLSEDDVVCQHADVIHSLRILGVNMKSKTSLDRLSRMIERDYLLLSEITSDNLKNLSGDFLYRTHSKAHSEINSKIELCETSSLKDNIDKHDIIADEMKRRKMIHPIWNNIDKFYNFEI